MFVSERQRCRVCEQLSVYVSLFVLIGSWMVGRDGMETRTIQQSLRVHLENKGGGREDD